MNARSSLLATAIVLQYALASHSVAACNVSAANLAFGAYDSFRTAPTDSAGNVAVICSGAPGSTVSYSIALNAGGAGNFSPRRMRSTSGVLSYNIYVDAARSAIWGDGNGNSTVATDSYALSTPSQSRNYPIYGRIFSGQNAPIGVYSDSIVVTLSY